MIHRTLYDRQRYMSSFQHRDVVVVIGPHVFCLFETQNLTCCILLQVLQYFRRGVRFHVQFIILKPQKGRKQQVKYYDDMTSQNYSGQSYSLSIEYLLPLSLIILCFWILTYKIHESLPQCRTGPLQQLQFMLGGLNDGAKDGLKPDWKNRF